MGANMEFKTNRGLLKYLIFSFLTLGIYGLYIIHAAAKETDETCKEDGKNTKGLLLYIVFSILTLGIYGLVWSYNIVERWAKFLRNRNQTPRLNGGGMYLIWLILGSFIGIGPLIAQYLFLHTWNDVNEIHNKELAAPQIATK
jgi:hypothetical protein